MFSLNLILDALGLKSVCFNQTFVSFFDKVIKTIGILFFQLQERLVRRSRASLGLHDNLHRIFIQFFEHFIVH